MVLGIVGVGHGGYGAHTIGHSGYGAWRVWGIVGMGHSGFGAWRVRMWWRIFRGFSGGQDTLPAPHSPPLTAYSDISLSSLLCTASILAISIKPTIIRISNYFHHKINCEIFVTDRVRDHLTKL